MASTVPSRTNAVVAEAGFSNLILQSFVGGLAPAVLRHVVDYATVGCHNGPDWESRLPNLFPTPGRLARDPKTINIIVTSTRPDQLARYADWAFVVEPR